MNSPQSSDDNARPTTSPADGSTQQPTRSIARRDLEQVIRRAAELTLSDADPDEVLTEDEVLRIASEVGLPVHHVHQALFELPELRVPRRWYDRWFDPVVLSAGRVVPAPKEAILRRVEDYLVTREFLQIARRRTDTIAFVPADDTISSLARALSRPGSRHTISRASRLMVGVRELPDGTSHVRFEADLSETRKDLVQTGMIVGGSLGVGVGMLGLVIAGNLLPAGLGPVPEIIGFGGAWAATAYTSIRIAAKSFRDRLFSAKMELMGLLDRLERGDRLDPPPAPWRRRLQLRLFGDKHGSL